MIITRYKTVNLITKISYIVFCGCIILLSSRYVFSQTVDSLNYSKYKFIKTDLNKIENDSISLYPFYDKLYQLEQTKAGRINITHIGDSHIQADILSGTIRQKLQLKFGNAGRGLVFPYRVAKSNEPTSYKTSTNTKWDAKRNVYYDKPLPIGISGFTIETNDSLAEINLAVKDQPGLSYMFTKFTLFHEKGVNNYDLTICDDANCERGVFKSSDKEANPYISQLRFENPIRQIILRNKCTDTSCQHSTRIYGMLLENDSSGVLYNMIGVNGSEYRHYTMSQHFIEQLTYLNSDLIIVSMGTNEGFSKGFNKDVFYQQIDSLINSVKQNNPKASLILTTPGDSYRRSRKGGVKNPDMKTDKETIINYCINNKIAYWDLYEIMGGFGSMGKWYSAKLSAKDRVHFNGKGYQIQGILFYKALMNGYEKYKSLHKLQ